MERSAVFDLGVFDLGVFDLDLIFSGGTNRKETKK
jgi:hypothetical protein